MKKSYFKSFFSDNNAALQVLGKIQDEVGSVKIDSRKVEKNDIFVAIRGEKNDANDFLADVYEKGAAIIISDKKEMAEKFDNVIIIENSLEFLQKFSSFYRDKINPLVIAITGSNGKTTTKDITYHVLSSVMKGKRTIGNLNNHIGVPLTLLQLEENDEFIVVEMGMSDIGEIDFLCRIAKPDYGVITNIGDSHMEYLKSREKVFEAKTEMIKYLKRTPVLNGDDEFLKNIPGIKVGLGEHNNFRAENIKNEGRDSIYEFVTPMGRYIVKLNLAGDHNILDAMLACTVALEEGVDINKVIKAMENTEITKMRFEEITVDKDIYINDAYNASPISMKYSIETFSKLYNEGFTKIAVLGDMLELGEKSREYHEELNETILASKIDVVFLYGKEMKNLANKLEGKISVKHFENKTEIIEEISKIEGRKCVLLKGSRGMKMEEILKK